MPKKGKSTQSEKGNEIPESQLLNLFSEGTQQVSNDPFLLLGAIGDTLGELEGRIRLAESDEDDDGFEATGEAPDPIASVEGANLFTAAEVANALKRDDTDDMTKSAEEPEVINAGLRSRFRRKKNQKQGKTKDNVRTAGIFGSRGKPPKWSLSHYLHSVASTREKRLVAVSAWIVALTGLIISLVFVTQDFLDGRKELASTVRYVDTEEFELPSLWFCAVDTSLPFFSNLPNDKFYGSPLLWLEFVRGTSKKLDTRYPETRDMPQFEVINVNSLGQPCGQLDWMDPVIFQLENTLKPTCFHCISIMRRPALVIQKPDDVEEDEDEDEERLRDDDDDDDDEMDPADVGGMATFRVAQNMILPSCRMSAIGLTVTSMMFMRMEIKKHHRELEQRGTLDFNGTDPSKNENDGYLWPPYRLGLQNTTADFSVYDIVDMLCNVYLFSGFFYPSKSKDIRFKFNSKYLRWSRSGNGTYYPPDFSSSYGTVSEETTNTIRGNTTIGELGGGKYDVFSGVAVQVMTNESVMGQAETLVVLEPRDMASVRLSKSMIYGKESYTKEVVRTQMTRADVHSLNNVYYLEVGFSTYLTRVVSDQLTVSWSAFIADFFGITSLFLDVSVYTLIVSPVVVRARKKAWLQQKMRRKGHDGFV